MNSIGLRHISVVRRIIRMASTSSSYEDAISKLNSLQSNKSTIEQIKKGLKTGQKCTNLEDMENYLRRVGIPLSKLDELSVIHVAGTKGKGSTSAMCESILRAHGFRTGFYSSPHLVSARERVRLGGRPLSRDQFAAHLHAVYSLLRHSQEFEGDMPKYFAFLTVVAFHVFLEEKVDVAVVEVGIGGVVDYTNVLRKVPVVGITALGLDHTSILGHTLPEIAAAKAGVMKRGCEAYTAPQPRDALPVLAAHARRLECPLTIVPDYTTYTFPEADKSYLPVDIDAYRTNASLAIQLAHAWMRHTQANRVLNSIDNQGIKAQNYLDIKILNDTQNGMVKEQNGTTKEHNFVTKERNGMIKEHNFMTKERNGMTKEHNFMTKERNGMTKEHNFVTKERNGITKEHNFMTKERNGMIKEQNGMKVVQNGLTNRNESPVNNDDIMQNNVTNGAFEIQNGIDSNEFKNSLNDCLKSQDNSRNSTDEDRNDLQDKITNGIQNRSNKVQNGLTNDKVLNDASNNSFNQGTIINRIQNTHKNQHGLQDDITTLSENTNKVKNGLISGNIVGKLVYEVPYETAEGLRLCKWPGRYQIVEAEYAKFYMDGAHTKDSVEICAQWFAGSCSSSNKMLIFTTTGDRDADILLRPLAALTFSHVYFVKPTAYEDTATNHDNYSLVERHELSERCLRHAQIWRKYNSTAKISVLECVADAFTSIKRKDDEPSVLITGSLHLVGAALTILDPNLTT